LKKSCSAIGAREVPTFIDVAIGAYQKCAIQL
jgi:hypothetical protein